MSPAPVHRRRTRSVLGAIVLGTVTAMAGCGQILGLGDPVEGGDAAARPEDAGVRFDERGGLDAMSDGARLETGAGAEADGGLDAGTDAADAAPPCDLNEPFGAPALVPGMDLNTSADEGTPRLSSNELTLYFWSSRPTADGGTNAHLYSATRNTTAEAFGEPSAMATVNSSANEASPTVADNGLTLVFESDRLAPASSTTEQLFIATRGSVAGAFLTPSLLDTTGWAANDKTPYLRPDGQVLYFSGGTGAIGAQDLYRAPLEMNGAFGAAASLAALDSSPDEVLPGRGCERPHDLLGVEPP